jgi:hypothetical protein
MDLLASLSVENVLFHFYYRKIALPDTVKYFIKAVGTNNESTSFEMKKNKSDRWEIIPPVHHKFLLVEAQLEHLLKQHEH